MLRATDDLVSDARAPLRAAGDRARAPAAALETKVTRMAELGCGLTDAPVLLGRPGAQPPAIGAPSARWFAAGAIPG